MRMQCVVGSKGTERFSWAWTAGLRGDRRAFVLAAASLCLWTFCVSGTTICIEAEDAVELEKPFEVLDLSGQPEATEVSGGKCLQVKQGAGGGSKAGGHAVFRFEITEPGTYYFWARSWWADSCSNSFGVKVGDAAEFLFGNNRTYKAWHWYKARVTLKLEKGAQELRILNREDGIKIDQILITSDRALVPVGIEKTRGGAK